MVSVTPMEMRVSAAPACRSKAVGNKLTSKKANISCFIN